MRKLGTWMLCFIAISWISVGGCQRPVVHSPEPLQYGSQRFVVPEPAQIIPPIVAMPQIPFGQATLLWPENKSLEPTPRSPWLKLSFS